MPDPMGAAAAARATTAVMVHFVPFLYSYGFSTSGTMAKRLRRPLRWARGTMSVWAKEAA